jgi:Outer membrane protein beta-barrel family/Carboxypeptidase regulatory-like domain
MRKLFHVFVLTCISQAIFCQTSSIKGTIRDTVEKKNLTNAVVSLLRNTDSVLVKFTRTDSHGSFNMPNLLPGDYVLMITYPKFADYADKITLSSQPLDLGSIPLTPKAVLLQEVVIRNNAAIKIKGDTTEFTADSFKVKEGATVEELLKQIPGMQVNSKGEITSQGKRVDKVLVDGEEFFGEDPTIATQNIGAKAVDKVQVYDTKTEQDQLKGIGASGDGNKTINIKLKESAKKGYFGTVEAGTDFDKLLNGKLMYNLFRGNKKVSVYGTKSNTNTGSLGWEDRNKLGIEEDYEYDEIGGYYYSYGDGDGDNEFNDWNLRGIPNAYTAGGLYGDKWNEEKNKLNLSYLYNRLGTENITRTISQTLLEDTTFFTNSTSKSTGLSQRHAVNGKYEWKIDSLASIKYTVAGKYNLKESDTKSYSEALDENKQFVNTDSRTNDLSSSKKQLDNVLTYKQLFHKKDRQLIATFRLGIIEDEQTGMLASTTNYYKNGVIDSVVIADQKKLNTGNSTTTGAKITYNEPMGKKWNLVAEYSFNNNHSVSHRNSFDKDPDQKYTYRNAENSNNFNLTALSNSGTLTARYVGKKLRAAFGTGLSAIQLNLNNLDSTNKTKYRFTGFTPQAQFGYKLKAQTNLSFSYRGNTIQPSLSQLQPLRNNTELTVYVGNPDLKVGFNHNLNLSFNDYKVLKGRYMFGNIYMSFMQNAIVNYSTVVAGKTTNTPVNVNGNYNWGLWSAWNSGQGDKKLNHELQPQANGGRSKNFLNGKENVNTYANLSLTYRVRYSIAEKYNFSIGPLIRRNISKSSLRPTANNSYWSYGGRAEGYVKLPGKFELSSDIDANLQPKTDAFNKSASIIVWNAELSRKFMKDKSFKIAIVAHDILNQNIGFNRSINSSFISEERFDRLARYFLLTASWTFNKMPGKN